MTPTAADISESIAVPGFAEAMRDEGWLLEDNGGVVFPNWDRWNTEPSKTRLQNRERQRRYRKQQKTAAQAGQAQGADGGA